ncbi:MAG: Hsp20/alpha crystallin family protein [Thermodesulfovibrionales bacterium]|nr:Hsp20/alpha crystallin family protein [Thermodesulfovibrionales bacterium]
MYALKGIYFLNQQIDDLFGSDVERSVSSWLPSSDVCETADRFEVVIELPGVKEDDIELEVKYNTLKVKGERRTTFEGFRYFQLERGYGGFYRLFIFPTDISKNLITARLKDGILYIEVDKNKKV